ncbi:MAG: sugar ABC transporter ATP-binding protein [Anaerolineaceae bacterium]|nr:sugar ABC transporter ATP-binding protein [Anaerolineaceae bacterium]
MSESSVPYRLEMSQISKAFPGVQALNNVSLQIRAGEIHALVGENGAGKSTLMKILSGAYQRDAGKIYFDGQEVEIHHPADALRRGIVMIYQESSLSKELSVAENIFCGRLPRRGPFVDWNQLYEKAQAALARFNANLSPRTLVKDLSPAQCQIVEIAKALSMSARLIVFDEPTAALTKSEAQTLFQVMQSLKQDGISIIFITHRLVEIFQTADRITVLRDGAWVTTADTAGLTEEKIILSMVGRAVQHQYQRPELPQGQPLLETRGLSGAGFTGISLHIQAGEIVGLFGLVGSGRTEFVRALFGADRRTDGVVLVDNHPYNFTTPGEAIHAGVVLVPEDRKSQGLVLGMPVRNNISLPNLLSLSRFQFIQARKENDLAETYRAKLDIRCPSVATPAVSLSGGNQQKVVIAKWLAKQPKVLIVDEPTRGIDVRAKAEVYNLMLALAEQGVGILMVSSELPEILGISDRIYVMHEGRLAGEVSRKAASEELIMTYASGQPAVTA